MKQRIPMLLFLLLAAGYLLHSYITTRDIPLPEGWQLASPNKEEIKGRKEYIEQVGQQLSDIEKQSLMLRTEADFDGDGRVDVARALVNKENDEEVFISFNKLNGYEHVPVNDSYYQPVVTSYALKIAEKICKKDDEDILIGSGILAPNGYEGMQTCEELPGKLVDYKFEGMALSLGSVQPCGCGMSYIWDGIKMISYQNTVCEGC